MVPLMTIIGKFTLKRATVTSVAAIGFISVGSLVEYLILGHFNLILWIVLTVTAVPATYFSAGKLSGKISDKWLWIFFFILMVVIVLKMAGVFDWITSRF